MSRCRFCNCEIRWRRTPRGKWQPVNEDGEPHHSSCRRGRKAAELVNKPLPAPGTRTRGAATVLYSGQRAPWLFDRWEWINPADELRYRARCQEGSYQGDADLFGDLDERFEQIMKGTA